MADVFGDDCGGLAEREGFEPSVEGLPLLVISSHADSTTLASLRTVSHPPDPSSLQGVNPVRSGSVASAPVLAERVGFEPTVPFEYNGFRDRPIQPLSHLSARPSVAETALDSNPGGPDSGEARGRQSRREHRDAPG